MNPRTLRHAPSYDGSADGASIVGQFMRTVPQQSGALWDPRLRRSDPQDNRRAKLLDQCPMLPQLEPLLRSAPTLREQERLSCMVELGLLSFESLAFEIQRRNVIAQAGAPPVRIPLVSTLALAATKLIGSGSG